MKIEISRLDSSRREDFYRIHNDSNGMGRCFCTAWWVTTWEEWDTRTAEQNRALREKLFEDRIYDGYIIYADNIPIGWCQCGPRDRMPKIRQTYNLIPDPSIWAVTCFFLIPQYREIGLAHYCLAEILKDLSAQNIRDIQGFPHRGKQLTANDVWTGPEAVFQKAGFKIESDDRRHPIYRLSFDKGRE
jgi:predicted acetyltransferase